MASEQQGSITKDPELVAMNKIAKLLGELTPDVRKRVLSWINEREQPTPATPTSTPTK